MTCCECLSHKDEEVTYTIDDAIFDFQKHVRKVTGGNNRSCVDSTELKKAIKKLVSDAKEEERERIRKLVNKLFKSSLVGIKNGQYINIESAEIGEYNQSLTDILKLI